MSKPVLDLLDERPRHVLRRPLRRALRRRRRAQRAGVVHPPAHLRPRDRRALGPVPRGLTGVGASRRDVRRARARDHAAVVLPRPPGDDRHALRGLAHPRAEHVHARDRERPVGPREAALAAPRAGHPALLALAPDRRRGAAPGAAAGGLPAHPLALAGLRGGRQRRAVHPDDAGQPHRPDPGALRDLLLGLRGQLRGRRRAQRPGLAGLGARRQRGALPPVGAPGHRLVGAARLGPARPPPRAHPARPLFRALLRLVRRRHHGQGARRHRDPRRRRAAPLRGVGALARAEGDPPRRRGADLPAGGDALVRGHHRAARQRVHPSLHRARHHQPHDGRGARRHRLGALLPLAARVRDVPVVGPRARRADGPAGGGARRRDAGAARPRSHRAALVRRGLRALQRDDHEVPSLHLPGAARRGGDGRPARRPDAPEALRRRVSPLGPLALPRPRRAAPRAGRRPLRGHLERPPRRPWRLPSRATPRSA